MSFKFTKFSTQNILDFVLTAYGSVTKIFDFIKEVGYTGYDNFADDPRKTLFISPPETDQAKEYEDKNIVVSTDNVYNRVAVLVCNDDLSVNKEVEGDFNDDFNNDFIRTELTTIIVGYEGTDIIITWTVTNNGNVTRDVNAVLAVTGYADRVITGTVEPNETKLFSEKYTSLTTGIKTITLTGLCDQEIEIEVLGSVDFQCNHDLIFLSNDPIRDGDTVTFQWSVNNNGTSNGQYVGKYTYEYQQGLIISTGNEIINGEVNVIINAGTTYVFQIEVVVKEGNYTFTSSCDDTININVLESLNSPNIVYNNDLSILPTNPSDGDTVIVQWSFTNSGTVNGNVNGFLEVYPSDVYTKYPYGGEVAASSTQVFTQEVILYACDRSLILSGDGNETLNISVLFSGIAKYVFWADLISSTPLVPVFSAPPLIVVSGTAVTFHTYLVNPAAGESVVNVKYIAYFGGSAYTFFNENVAVAGGCESGTFVSATLAATTKGVIVVELYLNSVLKGFTTYTIT